MVSPRKCTRLTVLLVAFVTTLCLLSPTIASDGPVTITYLANEGVHIVADGKGVLIDALFRDGVKGYATLDPTTRKKLESAAYPYDQTSLVLVTHYHRDHFDKNSVATHLKNNPKALLFTSKQVAERVQGAINDASALERFVGYSPKPMEIVEVTRDGIRVEFVKLSHGGGRFTDVWNLGYVVHIGGQRILHIGDAHLNDESKTPLQTYFQNVDVACLPYWWLLGSKGRDFVTKTLKPKHIIAFHIPPAEAAQVINTIKSHLPGAVCFTKIGMVKAFSSAK